MASKWKAGILATALALTTMPNTYAQPRDGRDDDKISHVLLISIDGMHAVDFANCLASRTCPNMAELAETGVKYTRTTTSRPSDSFPGFMALVSGGTPRTVVPAPRHHRCTRYGCGLPPSARNGPLGRSL